MIGTSLFLAAALTGAGMPTSAQPSLDARPVAGCEVAALRQQSRASHGGPDYLRFQEIAAYWHNELERVEPDAAARDALRKGAATALRNDLRLRSDTAGVLLVGTIIGACREERARREANS